MNFVDFRKVSLQKAAGKATESDTISLHRFAGFGGMGNFQSCGLFSDDFGAENDVFFCAHRFYYSYLSKFRHPVQYCFSAGSFHCHAALEQENSSKKFCRSRTCAKYMVYGFVCSFHHVYFKRII